MLFATSTNVTVSAKYTASQTGKAGIAVKVSVSLNGTVIAGLAVSDAVAATEIDATNQPGVYSYTVLAAKTATEGQYLVNFYTADTTVDQKQLEAAFYAFAWIGYVNGATGNLKPASAFPANFNLLSIDASGRVDVGKTLGSALQAVAGYMGLDWSHINAPTTTVDLSGTTVKNVDNAIANVTLVATTTNVTNDVGITQTAADKVWASAARTLTAFSFTVNASLTQILGTALTESVAGYLTAAFKKLFNVGSPTMDMTNVNQTGDSFARLGAPAGASVSADIAEIEAETDGIAAIPTNPLLTTDARLNDLDATISSRNSTAHFDTVIGTPAGASVSADLAEIEAETDGIAAIPTNPLLTNDARLPGSGVIAKQGDKMDLVDAPNVTGIAAIWAGVTQSFFAKFFTQDSGSNFGASVNGSVVKEIAANAATSSATIANAVLDAQTSAHTTPGSFAVVFTDTQGDVDELQTTAGTLATSSALSTAQSAITEIATDTDAILANVATAQTGITEIATDTDLLLTAVGTVLSKVNTFGEQEIFIVSPIVGGKITLYKSRDFNAADGQQLDIPLNIVIGSLDTVIWNGIGPLATSTPVTATGSYVDSGHCRVQLTATQCALFTLGIGTWEVVVTPHSTSRKVEAARGPLEIKSVVIP